MGLGKLHSCFLHVGTWKTGSTAIQNMLHHATKALNAHGLLYPTAGRAGGSWAHNDLIFQVVPHPSFPTQGPGLDRLSEEIAAHPGDVILSGEYLLGGLFYRDGLAKLIAWLQARGLRVVPIIYLRRQATLIPSAYLQSVGTSDAGFFSEFMESALTDTLTHHGIEFSFDHERVLTQIERNPDIDLRVRSYERASGSVTSDFLSLLGLRPSDIGLSGERVKNVTRPTEMLLFDFLEADLGRSLRRHEIGKVDALLRRPGIVDPDGFGDRIFQRFRESNARIASKWDLPELLVPPAHPENETIERISRWFSRELCVSMRSPEAITSSGPPSQSALLRKVKWVGRRAVQGWRERRHWRNVATP